MSASSGPATRGSMPSALRTRAAVVLPIAIAPASRAPDSAKPSTADGEARTANAWSGMGIGQAMF